MKRIGVKVPNFDALHTLKKDIIFFDKIVVNEEMLDLNIANLEALSNFANNDISQTIKYWMSCLEYLSEQGIVEIFKFSEFISKSKEQLSEDKINVILNSETFSSNVNSALDIYSSLAILKDQLPTLNDFEFKLKEILQNQFKSEQLNPLFYSEISSEIDLENRYIPIFFKFPESIYPQTVEQNSSAANFILKKIPLPSPQTSFEALIDFRKDEESLLKLNRLYNYINKLDLNEDNYKIKEEEFSYLMQEYRSHIDKLNIKFSNSLIQIILVKPLKFLENIVKLKWSENINSLLEIRKHNTDYSIAEQKAPGREIAFIYEVEKRFT